MAYPAFHGIQRRAWVFTLNALLAILTWIYSNESPYLALFVLVFVAAYILDCLESRIAPFLNPLLHNAPALLFLYSLCLPSRAGEEAYFAVVFLAILTPPCLLLSVFTAFLYWRDIRSGDY